MSQKSLQFETLLDFQKHCGKKFSGSHIKTASIIAKFQAIESRQLQLHCSHKKSTKKFLIEK